MSSPIEPEVSSFKSERQPLAESSSLMETDILPAESERQTAAKISSTTEAEISPTESERQSLADTKQQSLPETITLRRYKRSLVLALCYLPFLIVPWILTCILAERPLNAPSYFNQAGDYSSHIYDRLLFWMQVVRVLTSIGTVLTIPIISALLAHGAVVATQRRKSTQKASLLQIFALADRGWGDAVMLWNAGCGGKASNPFLWFAAALLALCAIEVPIHQALVSTEIIMIMTCQDKPALSVDPRTCGSYGKAAIIGHDPEPASLAQIPQAYVVREIVKKLSLISDKDLQANLWVESGYHGFYPGDSAAPDPLSKQFSSIYDGDHTFGNITYFVSASTDVINTGILREHALRLNSSAACTIIDESNFPSTCPGKNPFVSSYNRTGALLIEVCAPGNFTSHPWTLARDQQEINEVLFVRVRTHEHPYPGSNPSFGYYYPGFTVRCEANTTRGYFELGNTWNNLTAGPLLDRWPDHDTVVRDFNDYLDNVNHKPPSNNDTSTELDLFQDRGTSIWAGNGDYNLHSNMDKPPPIPGPLMLSALAMFGNDSFFNMASNTTNNPHPVLSICQANNLPFQNLKFQGSSPIGSVCSYFYTFSRYINDDSNQIRELETNILYPWIGLFANPQTARTFLEIAMYVSSETTLLRTMAATTTHARPIYYSPGQPVTRPLVSSAAKIAISVLIALQLVGIVLLLAYIYVHPTWVAKLDSVAVAQLVLSTGEEVIPPVGTQVGEKERKKLALVSGMIDVRRS